MTEEQKIEEQVTPEPAIDPAIEERKMLIKRVVKNADGGLDAVISLTPLQSHFLLNFAITFLLAQGAVQFTDVPEEESEVIDQDTVVLGESDVNPDTN